jgi:hypothetical protein
MKRTAIFRILLIVFAVLMVLIGRPGLAVHADENPPPVVTEEAPTTVTPLENPPAEATPAVPAPVDPNGCIDGWE